MDCKWQVLYDLIKKVEGGEDKELTLLYEIGVINLMILWSLCADALYRSECHNYPKKVLTQMEREIYGHSSTYYSSFLDGKFSAVYSGANLIKND